jgi:SnoaL-like domain
MTMPMSPAEQVQAQLARQKWAVDTRDAELLAGLYTADCEQVTYRGGPEGRTEISRSRGRDQIIGGITAGWARSAATWYPGSMIHQIGSCVTEPAAGGRIRCRSYASFLALDPAGVPVLKGYGTYDDLWVLDEGEWRLAYRENVMFGYAPSRR